MQKIKQSVNKIVSDIKKQSGVVAIILFGSYLGNRLKPLSDIDISVILKSPNKTKEAEMGSLYSDLFDISLFHRLPLYIQFEVLKYGKVLYLGDAKYFHEIKRNVLKEYLEMSYLYEKIERRVLA